VLALPDHRAESRPRHCQSPPAPPGRGLLVGLARLERATRRRPPAAAAVPLREADQQDPVSRVQGTTRAATRRTGTGADGMRRAWASRTQQASESCKGAGYLGAWAARHTRCRSSSPASSRICRPRYLANWPFSGQVVVELASFLWNLQGHCRVQVDLSNRPAAMAVVHATCPLAVRGYLSNPYGTCCLISVCPAHVVMPRLMRR
jgi:hypothetical protein